jgi:hypothetical protein
LDAGKAVAVFDLASIVIVDTPGPIAIYVRNRRPCGPAAEALQLPGMA